MIVRHEDIITTFEAAGPIAGVQILVSRVGGQSIIPPNMEQEIADVLLGERDRDYW